MMDRASVHSASPLDREVIAHAEVGHTTIAPALARALTVLFLIAIAAVPVGEVVARRWVGGDARSTAWGRLRGLPGLVLGSGDVEAAIGTPGPWNRIVAANRSALAEMAAFEDALDAESLLGQLLRPPAQYVLSAWLRAGNERVYVGRDGWLFYRPDVEYVTGSPFLDEAALRRRVAGSSEWDQPPQPDPRPAIRRFHQQLRERGIALIVVPTPLKPSIHPEKLADAGTLQRPVQNASYALLVDQLRADGVLVFDPADVLVTAAATGAQYLATDTHWRPEAMELVAEALAAFVRQHVALPDVPAPQYRVLEQEIAGAGDTAVMLDLPRGQQLYPLERVWIRRVADGSGAAWRPDRSADVLVLGDSFSNIYSLGSLGWGDSAGLVEQLSYALGRPLDRMVQNDDGAFATRAMLAQAAPERLARTKLVIWQFAARELAIGDWRLLDVPR
jgi:hypothetical protein